MHTAFILALLGYDHVRNHDASRCEWTNRDYTALRDGNRELNIWSALLQTTVSNRLSNFKGNVDTMLSGPRGNLPCHYVLLLLSLSQRCMQGGFMNVNVRIGKYLAQLREKAGLKQNELAKKVTWSPTVLSEGGSRGKRGFSRRVGFHRKSHWHRGGVEIRRDN